MAFTGNLVIVQADHHHFQWYIAENRDPSQLKLQDSGWLELMNTSCVDSQKAKLRVCVLTKTAAGLDQNRQTMSSKS